MMKTGVSLKATAVVACALSCAVMSHTAVESGGDVQGKESQENRAGAVTAALNGLEIVIDRRTGGILRLSYPGPGATLDTTPCQAGLVDLACPVPDFEPLRLAAAYSKSVEITKTDKQVVIHWDRLGASRPEFAPAGKVSATVTLAAADDCRSLLMDCRIENGSDTAVRQVIFPDLPGLLPFAGEEGTEFRTCGSVTKPFVELRRPEHDAFYAINSTFAAFTSGGVHRNNVIARWMDLGGFAGGLSLFPKRWGYDPRAEVCLHLRETDRKLRLMVVHDAKIANGETWESGRYVLTPHAGGWAKGIEPYRAWAQSKMKRICPLPEHIRTGLGFRTVWMCRNYPNDPQDVLWRFSDLPKLAAESKAHGLNEIVLWSWHNYFELPLPPPHPQLGGEEELLKAVAECKRLGVNVVPFISVLQAKEKTGGKYGVSRFRGNWTYHPQFIPRFTPPYAGLYRCGQVDTRNPLWQKEVLDSCKRLVDIGAASLSWDQFLIEQPEPNLLSVTKEIRAYSRRRDPQSTFSGEELNNIELSCDYLDYTWNWIAQRDVQPLSSVFPTPRINFNIDRSAADVKLGFMQNRFLNVQPRRPDDINASDLIANHAELSRALKSCAALRARFLPYFVDGTLIGDCILAEACPGAITAAYVLSDGMLVLVLNTSEDERAIGLRFDSRPWLASSSGKREIRIYSEQGNPAGAARDFNQHETVTTNALKKMELCVFEILPEKE